MSSRRYEFWQDYRIKAIKNLSFIGIEYVSSLSALQVDSVPLQIGVLRDKLIWLINRSLMRNSLLDTSITVEPRYNANCGSQSKLAL